MLVCQYLKDNNYDQLFGEFNDIKEDKLCFMLLPILVILVWEPLRENNIEDPTKPDEMNKGKLLCPFWQHRGPAIRLSTTKMFASTTRITMTRMTRKDKIICTCSQMDLVPNFWSPKAEPCSAFYRGAPHSASEHWRRIPLRISKNVHTKWIGIAHVHHPQGLE